MKKIKLLISVLYLITFSFGITSEKSKSTNLISATPFLIDCTDIITKEEAYRYLTDSKSNKNYLPVNAGYNKHPVWIYVPQKTVTSDHVPQCIRFNHTLLDSIEVWFKDSSGLVHWASLGNHGYKKWPALPAPIPVFVLPSEKSTDVLIRVKTKDVCALSIECSDLWNFNRSILKLTSFFWVYFGAICLLFIINFALSIAIRSASFLWYSLYVLTFALFQSAVCGFFSFWDFDSIPFIKNAVPFFGSISVASGSLFARSFLELYTGKSKILSNIFIVSFIAGLISAILSFYQDGRYASINLSILAPLFVIVGFTVGLFSIGRMGRPASLFTLGIMMLAVGIVLNALRNFGLLPDTTITAHGTLLGSILEFTIMTVALVDRISKNEREKAHAKELARISTQKALEDRIKTLQAQINPHFLFNALNSLAELIATSGKEAESFTIRLAKFFRYSLTVTEKDSIPLSTEINIIREYLEIQKVRLGNRLDYEILVNGDTESVMIPGLLIQPLIENSIKHGVAHRIEGGKIYISIDISEVVQIIIRDNGPGFGNSPKKDSNGHGLQSVSQRLKVFFKDTGFIKHWNDNGAVTEINFPTRIKQECIVP